MMDSYKRMVMKLACYLTGDKEFGLFTLHKALFQVLGFHWWDPPGLTLGRIVKRVVHPIFHTLLLITVGVLNVKRCFDLDTNRDLEFFIFMNNIITAFTFIFSAMKTIYMFFSYGKEAKQLMDMLISIGDLKQGRTYFEGSLMAFSRYWSMLCGLVMVWASYFMIQHGRLAFETGWPWDFENSEFGKLTALFLGCLTGFYCASVHSSVDSIVSVSCGIMTGHIVVLKDYLYTIGRLGNPDNELLITAVDLHVKIIKAAAKMNDCFNVLFALQSVYTVLHSCVLMFTFVKTEDLIGAFCNTMPMLMASYLQLFMYCYYSQMLTSAYEGLTFATYNNVWYRSSVKVQKGLDIISLVTKRTIALRGLGSFKASYASYLSSFQDSISYYLILKTVTATNEE